MRRTLRRSFQQQVKRGNQLKTLLLGRGKKSSNKGKEKEGAFVSLNPEGFYEVRVDYGHISRLASGCGFKNSDIEEVIQADNAQRLTQAFQNAASSANAIEEEDPDMGQFELDSNDELTLDEEASQV